MAEAIKKIKKAIAKSPKDPDNWIVWGLIMRTVGNYTSAHHKFKKALRLDPQNATASEELEIVEKIIDLDAKIPLDSVPNAKQNIITKTTLRDSEKD